MKACYNYTFIQDNSLFTIIIKQVQNIYNLHTIRYMQDW